MGIFFKLEKGTLYLCLIFEGIFITVLYSVYLILSIFIQFAAEYIEDQLFRSIQKEISQGNLPTDPEKIKQVNIQDIQKKRLGFRFRKQLIIMFLMIDSSNFLELSLDITRICHLTLFLMHNVWSLPCMPSNENALIQKST